MKHGHIVNIHDIWSYYKFQIKMGSYCEISQTKNTKYQTRKDKLKIIKTITLISLDSKEIRLQETSTLTFQHQHLDKVNKIIVQTKNYNFIGTCNSFFDHPWYWLTLNKNPPFYSLVSINNTYPIQLKKNNNERKKNQKSIYIHPYT